MIMDGKFRDKILQYNVKAEAGKMSALSSSKIDKNKYVTCEEILNFDISRMI